MKKILGISMLSFLLASTNSMADPATQGDINQVFATKDVPVQVVSLSAQEMRETDGAIAPLVAVVILTGGRLIVQRWVAQKVAVEIVKKGGGVLAKTDQQASAIVRAATNGVGKPIREYHPGVGSRYTHYHTPDRNGAHVWYGSPR